MIRVVFEYLKDGELIELQKTIPCVPNPGHKVQTTGKTYRVLEVLHKVDFNRVLIKMEEID